MAVKFADTFEIPQVDPVTMSGIFGWEGDELFTRSHKKICKIRTVEKRLDVLRNLYRDLQAKNREVLDKALKETQTQQEFERLCSEYQKAYEALKSRFELLFDAWNETLNALNM